MKNRERERQESERKAREAAVASQVGEYDNKTVSELKEIIKTLTGTKPRFMDKSKLLDIIKAHYASPLLPEDGEICI